MHVQWQGKGVPLACGFRALATQGCQASELLIA